VPEFGGPMPATVRLCRSVPLVSVKRRAASLYWDRLRHPMPWREVAIVGRFWSSPCLLRQAKKGSCGPVRCSIGNHDEVASGSISMSIRLPWRDESQRLARFFLLRAGTGPFSGGGAGRAFCSRIRLNSPNAKVIQNTDVNSPNSTAFRIVSICSSVG